MGNNLTIPEGSNTQPLLSKEKEDDKFENVELDENEKQKANALF